MKPRRLEVENNFLKIEWNNGSEIRIKLADLRRVCSCAECASEREGQSNSYIPIFSDEQISIDKLEPVGRYAISVKWKDGHATGVYEYSRLASFK